MLLTTSLSVSIVFHGIYKLIIENTFKITYVHNKFISHKQDQF